MAGVSDNGRKKWFLLPRKQFPLAEIRLFLKNCISTSRKTNPNKRVLFQVGRKSVSTSRNGMENLFKNTFLLDEKSAYIGKNI